MIEREVSNHLKELSKAFPALTIRGPRQAGKTTLVLAVFPNHTYANLEDHVRGKEYFLPYDLYPWFKNAKVADILDVTTEGSTGLRWKALDVDLSTDILETPERFPLVAK